MKNKLLLFVTVVALLSFPKINYGQAPTMGTTANFVLFSTNGPLGNIGTSTFTGDIGTNNGTCSGFLSVSGVIHTMDGVSATCAADLGTLYTQLNNTAATLIPLPTLGNGQAITAGAYSITTAASLNGTLTLNAQGNSNAVFIIKVFGAFSTNTGSEVQLINGAQACNIFWQVEGQITLGTGSIMKGTMVANNAAINMNAGVVLEGRALSTLGAISVNGVTLYMPTGCGGGASPVITTQPTNQTACAGNSISFSVIATGTGLTYQWRKGTVNLVNGGTISGATSAVLTINPIASIDAAANYNVIITGSVLPTVTSTNVTLVVNTSPVITVAAVNQTICAGSPVNFPVTATGGGLTYQWRNGIVNLSNGGSITGATSTILNINPVTAGDASASYNVVISGACAPNFTSANVSLAVNTLPNITTAAGNQVVCAGNLVNFSVTAVGTGITYQWRKGTVNLINGGTISGATSATLTINPTTITDAAANYNLVVSGVCAPGFTSANVSLVVNTSPTISVVAVNQTVCAGSPVSFPVTATGGGLTYQWRNGTVNLINAGTISGATSAILTINPVSATDASTNYNLIVSGSCAPSFTSANVSLAVNALPNITTAAVSQTVCAGNMVSFPVTATGAGITYQWRKGTVNLTNGGTISGATSAILTINPINVADAAINYNLIVSGLCAPAFTSANISLVVTTSPTITIAAINQTVCEGTSVSFPVTTSGTALIYQWRNGVVNLSNGGNISGATSAILTINPVNSTDASANYNLVISGACAPNYTSAMVSLGVNTSPAITALSGSQTVCSGGTAGFSVATTGSGLVYQWRIGTVFLTNVGNITGANSAALIINPVTVSDAGTNYNVLITGACSPTLSSANFVLVVNTSPTITTQAISQTLCAGSPVNFSIVSTGSGLTYQWRKGTVNLSNGGAISGVTSAVLAINPVSATDAGTNYNLVIIGTCAPSVTSANVSLFVNTSPVITALTVGQIACLGSPANFSVISAGTGLTYQWRKGSVNLNNGGTISGATSATLTISSVSLSDTGTDYNVVIFGTCAPSKTSTNVSLVVNTAPNITTQPNNQMAMDGNSLSISVVASGTGLTYQWRRGLINLVNGGNISGATSDILVINPTHFADSASNYNVVISGTCLPDVTSQNAIVWVCIATGITSYNNGTATNMVTIYPNPFTTSLNILINDASQLNNYELRVYNVLGAEVIRTTLTKQMTTFETNDLPSGTYFYKMINNNKITQSGRLVSQQ